MTSLIPLKNSASSAVQVPTYLAEDLTQNGHIAQIQLRDQIYTLRITRAGKLILTK